MRDWLVIGLALLIATTPGDAGAGDIAIESRAQRRGVVDFARAVGAELMTSFAVSAGSRDASGAWIFAAASDHARGCPHARLASTCRRQLASS